MEKSNLRKQLSALGVWDLFAWKRELQPLAHLLLDDEKILAATSGVLRGRRWLLAVTCKRYLFVRANLIGGAESFQLGPEDISGCTGKSGWLFGRLTLKLVGGRREIPHLPLEAEGIHGVLDLRNVPKGTLPLMIKAVEEIRSGS